MEIKVTVGFEPKAEDLIEKLVTRLSLLGSKTTPAKIEDDEEASVPVNPYAVANKKTAKKKATPVAEMVDEVNGDDEDEDDDFMPKKKAKGKKPSFEDADEEPEETEDDEDEAPAPVKKAKTPLATLDAVNDACKARAKQTGGAEGRAEVLGILKKKFKVTTVSELKPDQYAAVIKAMA